MAWTVISYQFSHLVYRKSGTGKQKLFPVMDAKFCKIINKKYVFVMPLIFALLNMLILLMLINVLFRVVIVIV